ncbi:hypothetical protein ILYODFUR_032133 [Ilyodon furcidens]|uniref:Uncharacterized protein n=1 Tax=Ilyodon furcidens TaxID=33524 RepID=A0ABV0UY58_9TELE
MNPTGQNASEGKKKSGQRKLFSLLIVYLYDHSRPAGTGGRQDEEATKGCQLIRFLSLRAPLPVLLSNPGGQRCLSSQTQWGNNWYKQHLTAETLSVIPNDISPVSSA